MSGVRGLRLRALLEQNLGVAVAVLVVLAAVGGWLTYAGYGQQETTVEQREVTVWESSGDFTHQATVIDNESRVGQVFTPGQVVGNRTVYYRSIMPILDVTFRYGYAAASGEVNVTASPRLVVRSLGQRNGMQVEYWRQTRSLGRVQSTLSPGERLEVPFGVNVTGTSATADRIHQRLGDPGETAVSVNVTVTAAGTVDGEQVDRTLAYSLPVAVQGGVYEVESGGDVQPFTRTERVAVTQSPGAVETVGGPLLLAGAVPTLLTVAYARREDRIAIGPDERAWLEYRDDRADFDEWISTVRLPEEAESLPVGRAESLADLVDLAIDTDNAVLESPDAEVYSVVYDGYRYTFEAPPEPRETRVPEGRSVDGDSDGGDTTEETDGGGEDGDDVFRGGET